MLADAGVHDARRVELAAGLPHAFEAPVGGVVVGARHDVEADRLEILGHRRRADDPDAAEFGLRHRRRPREIECGPFEVAERRIGVVNEPGDRSEPGRLRHRTGDDAVADRGEREAVGDAHRELALRIARRRRRLLGRDGDAGQHEKRSDGLSCGACGSWQPPRHRTIAVQCAVPIALIGAGASASAGEVAVLPAGYGVIGLLTGLLNDSVNTEKATVYVHELGRDRLRTPVSLFGSMSMIGVQVSAGR
jgi:hypothetical protein